MKWKSALTVEEAVLAVMGYKKGDFAYISLEKEIITNFENRKVNEEVSAWFDESLDIYKAIIADACVEVDDKSAGTQLEIHQLVYAEYEEDSGFCSVVYNRIDITKTTFTKQSLAQWFYVAGDVDKAKALVSDFNFCVEDDIQKEKNSSNQTSIIKCYKELAHWFAHDSLSITELSFLFMGVQPDAYEPKSICKPSLDEATKFTSMNTLLIKAVGNGKLKGWLSIRNDETGSFSRTLYEASSGSNDQINPSETSIVLTDLAKYLAPKRASYGEFYDCISPHSIICEDKKYHSLIAENEQLNLRIKELESPRSYELNDPCLNTEQKQNITPSLSEYLPVKGDDIKILSKAFQNFPTRFEHYKYLTPPKISVQEWLKSTYGCNSRKQDVFADILRQHFCHSN